MKTIGSLFLMFSFTLACHAQTIKAKDIPTAVVNAFNAKYPKTAVKKWEKEDGNYEAEAVLNGKEYEIAFDANGNWQETEREIKTKELPQKVKDGLAKSSYKDWEIEEVAEIESPEYKLAYELELEKGKQKMEVYFTPDGKLVKEEKEQEEKEEKD